MLSARFSLLQEPPAPKAVDTELPSESEDSESGPKENARRKHGEVMEKHIGPRRSLERLELRIWIG